MRTFVKLACALVLISVTLTGENPESSQTINLPTSKELILPVPGSPQRLNSFPSAIALSPDQRHLAILNDGFGTQESEFRESIAVLDLATGKLADFPDARMGQRARQSFFGGLAFSSDGDKLFASVGSLTDPESKRGGIGNGIAVYRLTDGTVEPEKVWHIPIYDLPPGKRSVAQDEDEHQIPQAIPYPAGIAVIKSSAGDLLLVADDLADDAILLNASTGEIIHRFDLSRHDVVPAEYPYAAVATADGSRGYVSLWNASAIAELDLRTRRVRRYIKLKKPRRDIDAGSHPVAMLLSRDGKRLYVALANRDQVAVIDTARGRLKRTLSTRLAGQKYGGSYPIALAQSEDGARLFVANAASDAVAVLDTAGNGDHPLGFIPTEWYPAALAVRGDQLFVTTAKGHGTGPNNLPAPASWPGRTKAYTYIPTLLRGSLATIPLADMDSHLASWTDEVLQSNRMRGVIGPIPFAGGRNPIRHVIYVVKENRSYDQILGDLGAGDGDPSLTMYGEEITPNEHKLARQFGILDNFYVSGEVSGNGHDWSTAAITSDYLERTWQIGYRGYERTYDYEGQVGRGYPLEEGIPDVNEPGTGYLWGDLKRHGVSFRHYGEFISSKWCNSPVGEQSPQQGTPQPAAGRCAKTGIRKGEALPEYLGEPRGGPSPYLWEIPLLARNIPTKPELRGHFDPRFPDFNLQFPDQLRVDEFLNEFRSFVSTKSKGKHDEMPRFILLRLPNDHTAGTRPGWPTPSASVADNDLALGRVVDAVSHSPYWDDTAIFVLEDDAQDGPDHVDAHRSVAWVISKYSPASTDKPLVDHTFYTTVNVLRTMEALLGLPPMNNNDARAALMAGPFSGPGNQPPFPADFRNRDNGLIYQMNPLQGPGAKESARMDFSHADAANAEDLNRILWHDRMKDRPYPASGSKHP